jgi:hypothetical protein
MRINRIYDPLNMAPSSARVYEGPLREGRMAIVDHVQLVHDTGTSLVQVVKVLAADPSPSPSPVPAPALNTTGVVQFIATKIAPILLAALGVIFISRAGKGEMSRVLTSSAIAIIGLAFIAGATALFLFGRNLVDLIFPTP